MNRSEKSISWDDLRLDVSYLVEEFMAFRRLVEWIPFAERPFGQESVADMLGSVHAIQNDVMIPLITDWQQTLAQKSCIHPAPALNELVRSGNADNQHKVNSEFAEANEQERVELVLQLLDHLVTGRNEIIELLNRNNADVNEKRIILDEHTISLSEAVQVMIRFERNELRKIAERIQVMETDRRS